MNLDDDSLYALLPAHHRLRDAKVGYPLRALLRVLSRDGAQAVESDIDAWQDALFVETCAEALLPRLAALVGAEPLRPLPASAEVSMRAFIGNALRYRRSKGTALTLELLARDVTAFTAKVVEYYARLSTTLTVRAPRTDRPATATLRDPEVRALHGTAFDRNSRVPDVRSIARARGRYNLPNVGVFLWRLDCQPYDAPPHEDAGLERKQVAGVPPALPWGTHPGHFTLAPAARELPLFAPPRSREGVSPSVQDVPDRLRRLPLWRELEARRAAVALERTPAAGWFGAGLDPFAVYVLRKGEERFRRLPPEEILIGALEPDGATVPPWTRPPPTRSYPERDGTPRELPVSVVLDPRTGRLVCAPPPGAEPDVEEVRVSHAVGRPGEIGGGAYDRGPAEAVAPGALVYVVGGDPTTPGTLAVPTLSAAIAAWEGSGRRRRGFIVVTDNSADAENAADPVLALTMPRDSELTIVAADWSAPEEPTDAIAGFLVRRSRRALLLRPLQIRGATPAGDDRPGRLTLDGVQCEAGITVDADALRALTIRHATLAPLDGTALTVAEPSLQIEIERSLCGALRAAGPVDRLALRTSVVAADAAGDSLDFVEADVALDQVTVLGAVRAKTLEASGSLLLAPVEAVRRQAGCVRYCYVDPAVSRLPRRYRCQPDLAIEALAAAQGTPPTPEQIRGETLRVRPVFVDDEPGEPAFALLALDAPREIAFGGEGGTEMGAYAYAGHALRVANLTDLFVDYLPIGLEAGAIGADRADRDARRSDQP